MAADSSGLTYDFADLIAKSRIGGLLKSNSSTALRTFCEVDHALEIDDDGGFIADHPGVVAGRQEGHIAGIALDFGAVVHFDHQDSGDMILEVGRLAALGLGDRLDTGRPAPARLQSRPADGGASDVDQFDFSPIPHSDLLPQNTG